MITRTRRNVGAVLAAGLAIGSAMALTSSGASGQEVPEATDPVYVPFGTLTIELGDRSGQLVFNPAAPGDKVTQPLLNEQPCNQITLGAISAGTGDLLSLVPLVNGVTGPGDSVQQPGEFLGVQTAGENCGRQAEVIGPDELLEIGLGSHFNSDVFVRSFSAAVDKKFNNDGDLTVGFDGGPQGLTKDVATGGSLVSITGDEIPAGVFTSATFASTSNKDNRGLSIGDATLELVTLSAEFDVAVDCNEQVTAEPGAYATNATFVRAENNQNLAYLDNTCDEVGAVIEILPDKIFWDNGTTGVNDDKPQDVVGEVTIDFTPLNVAASDALEREIDLDAGGATFDFRPLLWCDSYSKIVTGDGTNTSPLSIVIDVEQPSYADGTVATWCKVKDTRTLGTPGETPLDDDLIFQTVVLAGGGDPWVR